MRSYLKTITVTGADDSSTMMNLIKLQRAHPLAEFGILLSPDQKGGLRFPSSSWLKELERTSGLNLAGHLCGPYARRFLMGELNFDDEFGRMLTSRFSRWQINTHGIFHSYDPGGLTQALRERHLAGHQIIFQYDIVNLHILDFAIEQNPGNVETLFDLSHGAGILPASWPALNLNIPVGYAGGLSSNNLTQQIPLISQAAGEKPFWIDAETELRSAEDSIFDLQRVNMFLATAASNQ